MAFDTRGGSDSYIDIPISITPGGSLAPYTFMCWYKQKDLTLTGHEGLIGVFTASNSENRSFVDIPTGGPPRLLSWGGNYIFGSVTNAQRDGANGRQWNHIIVRVGFSPERQSCVLNGAIDNQYYEESTNIAPNTTVDRFSLGKLRDATPSNQGNVIVAEAALWNNVYLTDAEVRKLAVGYLPTLIRPDKLYRYASLRERQAREYRNRTITPVSMFWVDDHPEMFDGTRRRPIAFVPAAGGDHDLLADDAESASEVTSPAIGQVHALLADDAESASEVGAPSVGQVHGILADDAESASEVSAPAIGQANALLADDVESASEVTAPAVGQVHGLTADDAESASEVTAPSLGQIHALLANDAESASEVSAPILASGTHDLLADDVEAASEVTSPALGQVHALLADDAESASEVTSPRLNYSPSAATATKAGLGKLKISLGLG